MFLYRFSNYSNLNHEISWEDVFSENLIIDEDNFRSPVKIECFSLSENDKKHGDYLSFIFADGINSIERIKKCFSWLKEKRNNSFPNFFGFCEIDKDLAEKKINDENEIISFFKEGILTKEGTIHYGMKYTTDNDDDILEAQTSLVTLSTFFPCKNKIPPREIGIFSNKNNIIQTYTLD